MADSITYESVIVSGEQIEPGLLIWRRYKVPAKGVTEIFLDINPHIRQHMRNSIYLPVGVSVLIPIIKSILQNRPQPGPTVRAFGTVE